MNRRDLIDYRPEILGMTWTPGNLILVASRSWGGRVQYMLGNCIVEGTKDKVPVALFALQSTRAKIAEMLMRMQVGDVAYKNGKVAPRELTVYPVYIDDTPNITIARLVEQIFRLVEQQGIQMVIIEPVQAVDGSLLDDASRERELNGVLRILKSLADALSIVIVVCSELSDYGFKKHRQPTVRDIQYITETEDLCDQIILFHPLDIVLNHYKMILPKGFPYYENNYGELVINVERNGDKGYFRKATTLFEEREDNEQDPPMYEWYPGASEGEWCFEFLDAEGMGWTLIIDELSEDDALYHQITVQSWSGEEDLLDDYVDLDDIELVKAVALEKAREHFPEVVIPDNS